MKLTPHDLGERYEAALLQKRGQRPASQPDRELGTLGKLWTQGLPGAARRDLGTTAAGGWTAALCIALGTAPILGKVLAESGIGGPLGVGILLAGAGAAGAAALVTLPRALLRYLHGSPLTDSEVAALAPRRLRPVLTFETVIGALFGQTLPVEQVDPLEESYWRLVRELLALDVADESTASELRGTLRSLGDAIASLPQTPALGDEVDIADLIADAEGLLYRAKRERDPVVQASLQRQAEAMVRQARGVNEAIKIARRTGVLRQELRTQIEAFRSALPPLSRRSGNVTTLGSGRFAAVAEQVKSVAQEAASVAAAQEELARAVGVAPAPTETRDAYPAIRTQTDSGQKLRLGRRG